MIQYLSNVHANAPLWFFTLINFAVHCISEYKFHMKDFNTVFWKFNFWCHHELVGSGRIGILPVIGGSGRVQSLVGRVLPGQEKWARGVDISDIVEKTLERSIMFYRDVITLGLKFTTNDFKVMSIHMDLGPKSLPALIRSLVNVDLPKVRPYLINQSINQSVNQSINQSINQSFNSPTSVE